MGLFSCCTKNVVDHVITTTETPITEGEQVVLEEKAKSRKITSASSKESKDSGCPSDSIISEQEAHKGDGDQLSVHEEGEFEDRGQGEAGIITEDSPVDQVEQIENEQRPETPELCLTGVAMTQDSVKKIQTASILEELSSANTIADSVQSPSGVAYTFGESFAKRLPPRLPPITPKKNVDRKTIDNSLKKAQDNKQKQLSLVREKSMLREERRKTVLERKKANMDLNKGIVQSEDEEHIPSRRHHNDEELIAPSTLDF